MKATYSKIGILWCVLYVHGCFAHLVDPLLSDCLPLESITDTPHRFNVNSVVTTGSVTAGNSLIVKAGNILLHPLSAGVMQTNVQGEVTATLGNPGSILMSGSATPTWGTCTSQQGTIIITKESDTINFEVASAVGKNPDYSEACCNTVPNTIVRRDASGNFAAHMITLDASAINPTDVVTKEYVDTVTTLGLVPLQPVIAVSTEPVTMQGIQTIDGVTVTIGDRVLLTAQEEAVNNGIWKVKSGVWKRPLDFASDARAGRAYVLVTSGVTYNGSSWLCGTHKARIDSDELSFALFSLPIQLVVENIGEGTGHIFKNKTGNIFNLKTIAAHAHLHIMDNPDDITITTDATAAQEADTLVARDGQGNFAAHVITADLHGNAATATSAQESVHAYHADHALTADQALQATRALQTDCAACADTARTFIEPLAGDVIGNQTTTIVGTVGGQPAEQIAQATQAVHAATATNISHTLVARDEQGNFAAHIITADLNGNAATATSAQESVHAQQSDRAQIADQALQATKSDQSLQADHALVADQAKQADHALHSDKAVIADQALQATRALQTDCAACADTARTFTEPLVGDVIGNQTTTKVVTVGDQSAEQIAIATHRVQTATPDSSAHSLVVRDALGNFAAQMITIHGSVANPTDVATKSYVDSVTSSFTAQSAEQIATATQKIQEASAALMPTTLVMRDEQGNFTANIITADLQGNAATATKATYALQADHALSTDQAKQAVHALQADKAAQADYALSANQAKKSKHALQSDKAIQADHALLADHALVADKAGESQEAMHALSADNAVQAARALQSDCATYADKATHAVQATIFTEPLAGDVVGNQANTVVTTVGGQLADAVATATKIVHAATVQSKPDTLVVRDGDGAITTTCVYADVQGTIKLNNVTSTGLVTTNAQGNLTPLHTTAHALCVGNDEHTLSSVDGGLDGQVLVGATGKDPAFASLTSNGGTIKITRGPHTINIETSLDNLKEFPTDSGIALPSGGRLAIRGSQNMRVRAIGSSIIIAMNNSPAVSGSLTAGATITAGTGLTVVSGGATITGDTNINSAGVGATTIGNACTATMLHGAVGISDSLEIHGKASFDHGLESRAPTIIAAADETPVLTIKNGNQQTTPLRLVGIPHAAGAPLLIDAQGNISTAPSSNVFTENIRSLTTQSEKLYALDPVIFDYKSPYDVCKNQYGLIAEEVEKNMPELVVYKQDGTPYTVSYHLLIPLLLKELQKHQKVLHDLTACDDCKEKLLSAAKK